MQDCHILQCAAESRQTADEGVSYFLIFHIVGVATLPFILWPYF